MFDYILIMHRLVCFLKSLCICMSKYVMNIVGEFKGWVNVKMVAARVQP